MQYQITLTFPDVADVFEIAEILAPLKGSDKVKFAAAQPRPTTISGSGVGKPAQDKIAASQVRLKPQPPPSTQPK